MIHIYTITFDANGSISDIISKEVRSTEKYGDLPIPTREFYIFEGWYKELSFTNEITNNTLVLITKNTTLYAKWNPVSFTISFQSNGGTPVDPITQQHGSEIVQPKEPQKEGYIFVGWFEDSHLEKLYIFSVMPTQNN